MRHRFITFLVFGAILVGIGEWDLRNRKIEPLQKLNDWWLEFCVANSRDKISDPAITFVRINDDYEPQDLGIGQVKDSDSRKKLTQLDYAVTLGFLEKLSPKSVAIATVPEFTPTPIEPVKEAAAKVPRMTLGSIVATAGDAGGVEYPALSFNGDSSKLPEIKRTVRTPDPQLLSNGDPAFIRFEESDLSSEDGKTRVPILARQGDKVVPSFVLHAIANHAGVSIDQIEVDLAAKKPTVSVGEALSIPVDEFGNMIVSAHSGVDSAMISKTGDGEKHHFASLALRQIHIPGDLEDEVAQTVISEKRGELESIKENLTLIGFDRKMDRQFKLADGSELSRAGLIARAIATAQSGRFIEWWPSWVRWLAVLALVALAFFLIRFDRGKAIAFGGIATLFFIAALVLIFKSTLSWSPPFVFFALPVLLLLVCAILPSESERRVSSRSPRESEADPELTTI